MGRSVTEFGVEPNANRDQTAALQKAIGEIAKSGQPAFIPPGSYQTGKLILPSGCQLTGAPGLSTLRLAGQAPLLEGRGGAFRLSGIVFNGGASNGPRRSGGEALITIAHAAVKIEHCLILETHGGGLLLEGCSGAIEGVEAYTVHGPGLSVRDSQAFTINHCALRDCAAEGIKILRGKPGESSVVAFNKVNRCGTGVHIDADALVTGNVVEAAAAFGLRLGGAGSMGHLQVINNHIRNARTGIGLSAAAQGYALVSLNMILGAKEGAIRALDGDKLIGPDLARSSAEAFRNLAVMGNVAL